MFFFCLKGDVMSIESLKSVFKSCIDDELAVCVVITLPDREDGELIITTPKNLDYKMNYYLENYNEQLELKRNSKIKIIDAFPINLNYEKTD